jgi:hypothetical protein
MQAIHLWKVAGNPAVKEAMGKNRIEKTRWLKGGVGSPVKN